MSGWRCSQTGEDSQLQSRRNVSITEITDQHRSSLRVQHESRVGLKEIRIFHAHAVLIPPSGWGEQRQKRLKDLFIMWCERYWVSYPTRAVQTPAERRSGEEFKPFTQLLNIVFYVKMWSVCSPSDGVPGVGADLNVQIWQQVLDCFNCTSFVAPALCFYADSSVWKVDSKLCSRIFKARGNAFKKVPSLFLNKWLLIPMARCSIFAILFGLPSLPERGFLHEWCDCGWY